MALNILSLNVNRVHDNAKHAGILQLLLVLPSVLSLQQAHCVSLAEGQTWFLSSSFEFFKTGGQELAKMKTMDIKSF